MDGINKLVFVFDTTEMRSVSNVHNGPALGANASSVRLSDPQELVGVPTNTLQEIKMTGKKLNKM